MTGKQLLRTTLTQPRLCLYSKLFIFSILSAQYMTTNGRRLERSNTITVQSEWLARYRCWKCVGVENRSKSPRRTGIGPFPSLGIVYAQADRLISKILFLCCDVQMSIFT